MKSQGPLNTVLLSLGSNQGDRQMLMERAIGFVIVLAGDITRRSGWYESKAWGLEDQPDFLNICLEIETRLPAPDLMDVLQDIEGQLHRQRMKKWGPRTIDIDILFYNNDIIQTETLAIPHPYIPQRRFVLLPLAEIAAGYTHPILHKTVQQLLDNCPDELEVIRLN